MKTAVTNFWNRYRGDIYCSLALAVLVLVLFYDPLLTGRIFYLDDIGDIAYPQRKFQFDMVRDGAIHLWNPYQYGGNPYFADPVIGLFYPLNWLFFFVSPERGLTWFIILHIYMGGFFTYLMLRGLQASRSASMAGAIFFAFAGPILIKTVHFAIITAICLVPLILFLLEKLVKARSVPWMLALAAAMGMHLLFGFAAFSQIMYVVAGLYLLAHLDYGKLFSAGELRLVGLFSLSVVFSLGIAAIQFIPSYEFMQQCTRTMGFSSFNLATACSMWYIDLLTFFVPDYFGNPLRPPGYIGRYLFWDQICYIGIIPVILAIGGACMLKKDEKRQGIAFSLMILFTFLYALGEYTPFYKLFYDYFPFGKSHHIPLRGIVFLLPGIAYFIARAVDRLIETPWAAEAAEKKRARLIFGILAAGFIGLLTLFLLYPPAGANGKLWMNNQWIMAEGMKPTAAIYTGLIFFAVTGVIGLVLIFMKISGKIKNIPFAAGTLAVLVVSAFSFGYTWNPTESRSFFDRRAKLFEAYQYQKPPARIYYRSQSALPKTWGTPNTRGVCNLLGYNPLMLRNYLKYMMYAEKKRMPTREEVEDIMHMLGNRYPFAENDLNQTMILLLNLQAVYRQSVEGNTLRIWSEKIENPYPRVFMVDSYRVIPDEEQMLAALASKDFNPFSILLLAEDPGLPAAAPAPERQIPEDLKQARERATAGIEYRMYEPDRIILKVKPDHPAWLFLSEIYFTGWKARVNGKDRLLYRGNYLFRAVHLEPGDELVEIYFQPDSMKTGAAVTGITFLCMGTLLALHIRRSRRSTVSPETSSTEAA